jgi:branched-chain amino acid transport system ATP-binding protein
MLEVNNLDVSYGDLQVLWKVKLKVNPEELVAICGSNGAGKSTLLKTIAGIIKPRHGSIKFFNENITNLPPHEIVSRGVCLVPEGRNLFPFLTVEDNLNLGAWRREAEKRKAETIQRVFELFPVLKERRKQIAGTLSGGEQQMLAIGRGLMSCPKLLMLDEPSNGLAPKLVKEMFDVLVKLKKEEDMAIVLVEQNIQLALKLAHRAYIFENGRVALEGTGEDLIGNEYVRKIYLGVA